MRLKGIPNNAWKTKRETRQYKLRLIGLDEIWKEFVCLPSFCFGRNLIQTPQNFIIISQLDRCLYIKVNRGMKLQEKLMPMLIPSPSDDFEYNLPGLTQ